MDGELHLQEEYIKTDREAFRAQATEGLRLFTTEDRELAASITTATTPTRVTMKAWEEQIEPVFSDLEQRYSDTKLKKYLIKTLGFADAHADAAVEYLIEERRQALLLEVLDNIYPKEDGHAPYQRHNAASFLSQNKTTVTDFFARYANYSKALQLSKKFNITLCDPHASWLERQRAALQINKERSKLEQNEDKRLDEITEELEHLIQNQDSLVGAIVEKKWNFITILDLRAKYQKQVDLLEDGDQANPNKRLKLFERVTQSFRDSEAEKMTTEHRTQSLKALRIINESIYDLLLEIFDLSTTKRNKLLVDIQKHTKLSQERDLILLIQRNREHFLAIHD